MTALALRSDVLRRAELALWFVGLTCVSFWVVDAAWTSLYQRNALARLSDALAGEPTPGDDERLEALVLDEGELIGRIDIPEVGISAAVLEGIGDETLRLGIGHVPGTPHPGQPGNAGLAGHRDTLFRGLRHIGLDDEIRITTPYGERVYVVEDTRVVDPTETWVLDPTEHEAVTLVTCYPFSWIGPAPRRFIVRARRVEEPPVVAAGATGTPLGEVASTASGR